MMEFKMNEMNRMMRIVSELRTPEERRLAWLKTRPEKYIEWLKMHPECPESAWLSPFEEVEPEFGGPSYEFMMQQNGPEITRTYYHNAAEAEAFQAAQEAEFLSQHPDNTITRIFKERP